MSTDDTSAMKALGLHNLPRFEGEDFHMWKIRMENALIGLDYIEALTETPPTGDDAAAGAAAFKRKDMKCRAAICTALDDTPLLLVNAEKTAKAVWDKLLAHYEKKSLNNKLFLLRKLFNARMGEGDDLTVHVNSLRKISGQLSSTGDFLVLILLASLPDSNGVLITLLKCANLKNSRGIS